MMLTPETTAPTRSDPAHGAPCGLPAQCSATVSNGRRAMRAMILLWLTLTPWLAGSSVASAAQPVMPIDQIVRGQTGYGLSVFSGNELERFEVEVIGVMRNQTAELSYVLARLSGHDLETSGVAAGMSGSPVYIDDKLVGAVAFSWNFSRGAIAGITPIEGMRNLGTAYSSLEAGASRQTTVPSSLVPSLESIAKHELDSGLLERAFALLRPSGSDETRPAMLWQANGFSDVAAGRLRQAVGPLSTSRSDTSWSLRAGNSETSISEPADLRPLRGGDAIAMPLVTGDLGLAAHGTITEVDGDRLVAFGHSVFGLGPTLVPMARSEVLTVISSVASSFKLSNAGAIIGAFNQDREAGAQGIVGLDAPMVPLTVALRGLEQRDYTMQLAEIPALFPTLVSIAVFGALNAGSYSAGDMGVDLDARIRLAGHDDLVLKQSFDSDNAGGEALVYLLGVVAYLVGNDLEATRIEGLEVTLEQSARPRVATVLSAHTARTSVAPGDEVTVTLTLQPFRGPITRHQVPVTIPANTDDGRYIVFIGDGVSVDGALQTVAPTTARTLDQALDILGGYRSASELAVLGLVGGAGLSVDGDLMPGLPASMRSLIADSGRPRTSLTLVVADHTILPAPTPISGLARLDFQVRKPRR